MSRDELPPFIGGEKDFPPYYRLLNNWTAGLSDHTKFQHLLTTSPVHHGVSCFDKIYWNESLPSCRPELTGTFFSQLLLTGWMYIRGFSECIYS